MTALEKGSGVGASTSPAPNPINNQPSQNNPTNYGATTSAGTSNENSQNFSTCTSLVVLSFFPLIKPYFSTCTRKNKQ